MALKKWQVWCDNYIMHNERRGIPKQYIVRNYILQEVSNTVMIIVCTML